MYKKLVTRNDRTFWLDRNKISGICSREHGVDFIIDGVLIYIDMHIDNAILWLTSTEDK